jgi:hypothetical protein
VLGGALYRPERRGQGRPVGGRRRLCWRRARATPASTALLACWRVVVSAAECCGSVLARSRRSVTCSKQRKKRGGSWALSSSSPPFLTARVGAEGAWLDCGDVHACGYRVETNGDSNPHSKPDFSDFCLPGVRHNARKKFEFEILKMATMVRPDIGQGV